MVHDYLKKLLKQLKKQVSGDDKTSKPRKENRSVFFEGPGFHDTPIYERKLMPGGYRVEGPAIIEEEFSSTVLIPGSVATIDEFNNIVIDIN